jgi:hypothetical protein
VSYGRTEMYLCITPAAYLVWLQSAPQ